MNRDKAEWQLDRFDFYSIVSLHVDFEKGAGITFGRFLRKTAHILEGRWVNRESNPNP